MEYVLNWVAILVAAFAGYFFGWIWYSPALFANEWMALAKIPKKWMKEGMSLGTMAIGFVSTFVTALVLAAVIGLIPGSGALDGAFVGLLVWLGFIATTSLGGVLWERKPWKLWLLNNAYSLLFLVLMGLIIGAW